MTEHPVTSWARVNTYHSFFFDICEKSYSEYLLIEEEIINLQKRKCRNEFYDDFIELENLRDALGFHTILYAAMCIEASIFDYAATQLGDEFVKTHFEKIDLLSKWVIIPKYVCGAEINKNRPAYAGLKQLIKTRNALVHHKSSEFTSTSDHFDKIEKKSKELRQSIRDSYRTLVLLSLEMDELLGNQFNPLKSFDKKTNLTLKIPKNLINIINECKNTHAKSKS